MEVVFESVRPVVAEVDEVKMTLIMTNLVENAIKYNKDHGWVKVVLDADHQYLLLKSAIPESVFRRNPWHTSASVLSCGQVPFQRDRRNRTGAGDHEECGADAQRLPYGDQYRRTGILFPGEDSANVYSVLEGL